MKAILLKSFGNADQLYLGETAMPILKSNELLVKIHATALNRADIIQRQGKYPPPKGESEILGLEMAGEVIKVGDSVTKWNIGDKVCGLLAGGGYAEFATIHQDMALPIPYNLSYIEATAIPEVYLTAYQALNWISKLKADESILIHAGASGVGTAAIQLASVMKAKSIFITASQPKHQTCLSLGATDVIDYKTEDFEAIIKEKTNGRGVNIVIDFLAAPYFQKNINVLAKDGRMVMLALMGGFKADSVNLIPILKNRLQIQGSTLRARSIDYKIKLTQGLYTYAWNKFEKETLKPVVDSVFPWEDVKAAQEYMEANKNKGKIVLRII